MARCTTGPVVIFIDRRQGQSGCGPASGDLVQRLYNGPPKTAQKQPISAQIQALRHVGLIDVNV